MTRPRPRPRPTPARLAEIRRRVGFDVDDVGDLEALDLLAEIDALRSLPVLETCRPCRHWLTVEGGAREVCFHPDSRNRDGTRIYAYLKGEPPENCPLRRKEPT